MRNHRYIGLLFGVLLLSACDIPDWLGNEQAKKPKLQGERISVLDYDSVLSSDESLAEESVPLADVQANQQFPYDVWAQLNGYENLAVTGLNDVGDTSVGDGAPFKTILVSPPVIGDGVLYAMDAQGYVSAHNPKDLDDDTYWVSEVPVLEDEGDIGGGGLAYANGVVYVTTGYGATIALVAKDGSMLWRRDVDAPVRAAPLVASGKVFSISIDNQLFAYDARTGRTQWNHKGIRESAVYLGSVSPSYENGIVIAAYTTGEIYALRAEDGSPIWSDALIVSKRTSASSSLTGIDATPVIQSGIVYGLSNSGLMTANLLSNGRNLWEHEIAGYNTPWAAAGYVFVLTNDNNLMAIKGKDGGIKWITSVNDPEEEDKQRCSGPMIINGKLVVVNDLGTMFIVNVDSGEIEQRVEIPDGVNVPPVVANGTMYLLSSDATLHSYR